MLLSSMLLSSHTLGAPRAGRSGRVGLGSILSRFWVGRSENFDKKPCETVRRYRQKQSFRPNKQSFSVRWVGRSRADRPASAPWSRGRTLNQWSQNMPPQNPLKMATLAPWELGRSKVGPRSVGACHRLHCWYFALITAM